jgi:hypothetical protein
MAQDNALTPEELQKQIEIIDKQKELAKAQKERIDAENALAAAQRADAAQLSEPVATANAARQLAEARKAQSDAEAAALKAAIGEVPSTSLSGAVTAGTSTGDIEATLLAAKAVGDAAATIAGVLRERVPAGATIVAMAVSEIPAFQNHIAYQTQLGIVKLALEKATSAPRGAAKEEAVAEAAALPLAGAGLVLDAANKLLSFFRSEYSVAGVSVEASDLIAVTAVAGRLAETKDGKTYKVIAPAIFNGKAVADAGAFLVADITGLAALREVADSGARKHDAEADARTKAAAAEQDPARKREMQDEAVHSKGRADALRAAMAIFDTWFAKLSTPDDKGVVGLVTIAKEKAIVDQLAGGGQLLAIKVVKAGGSYLTKRNLWTLLGGMPLYHMGGASVAFALLDGTTGRVTASGVVPVYGGFVKAGKLKAALSTGSRGPG